PEYNEDAFSSGNAGVPGERGYTGNLGGWSKVKIDLSSYTGNNNLYIRWHFGSDGSVTYDGWFVDDVRVGYPDYSVGVEEIPKEVEVYLERSIGIGGVEVRYGLPRAGKVDIRVYDISGRQVYGKAGIKGAGYHSERIEVRGAGVYFVRVNAGGKSYRYKLVIF
ncbi:MAG TPA: T9SS type A sorting domain-containing protein, partial [candidate division WOR-3 bacterium]|nr:T9SS type A sorting domain-containing protein [candidate division WOR-3 bacterium]